MSFLNSIQTQSKKHEFPFDHWEYSNALTDGAVEEIIKADIPCLLYTSPSPRDVEESRMTTSA